MSYDAIVSLSEKVSEFHNKLNWIVKVE